MPNINLLPWRAEQRARSDRKLFIASLLFWGLCLVGGFLAYQAIQSSLDNQNERNQYLTVQNNELKRQIADIEKLQLEKQELIERIDVVQNLQQDRMRIVHVFDDLVRKLPPGITLDKMSKKSREIHLNGRAQSNSRVSELMNQLDTSQWFGKTDLAVVSLKETEDSKLNEFELAITETVIESQTSEAAQ